MRVQASSAEARPEPEPGAPAPPSGTRPLLGSPFPSAGGAGGPDASVGSSAGPRAGPPLRLTVCSQLSGRGESRPGDKGLPSTSRVLVAEAAVLWGLGIHTHCHMWVAVPASRADSAPSQHSFVPKMVK